jgi:hypothetical protein
MSFVNAAPEYVAMAATDLASIGSALNASNLAALAPTTGVLAAGADDVSAAVAGFFGAHAEAYQAIGAQMTSFQQQFVQQVNAGAAQYAATEAQSASSMQQLQSAASSPVQTLTGHPLIGTGANVLAGTGDFGGTGSPSGWFFGNGGNGASGAVGGNGGSAAPWSVGTGGNAGAGGVGARGPVGEPSLVASTGGTGGAGGWLSGLGGSGGHAGSGVSGGNGATAGFGGRLLGQVSQVGQGSSGGNNVNSGKLFGRQQGGNASA